VTPPRVLVELSVVEQRYQAVLQVLSGASVTEVAHRFGVSRQAVHLAGPSARPDIQARHLPGLGR
jgi:hypothetical protein